jgi:hypothetical protein
MRPRYIHPSFWQNPVYTSFGSPIDDGISHLRVAIYQNTGAGINNIGGAIQALQAAGNEVVGSVGPAIDSLAGGAPDVMKMTHWAWVKNAEMAGIRNTDTARPDDLLAAGAAAKQMLDWYSQAYRLAQSKHFVAPQVHPAYNAPIPAYSPPPTPAPIAEKSLWQKVVDWLVS